MQYSYIPSVFIGLGEDGQKTASDCYKNIEYNDENLYSIIDILILNKEGLFDNTGYNLVKVEFSDKIEKGIFPAKNNLKKFNDQYVDLTRAIRSHIEKAKKGDNINNLTRYGIKVDDDVHILIFSSLFDPVGSVVIVPILKLIKEIESNINAFRIVTSLFLSMPPIPPENSKSIPNADMARTYATFSELDNELSKKWDVEGSLPRSRVIWIYGNQNSKGNLIENEDIIYESVANIITRQLSSIELQKFPIDSVMDSETSKKKKGTFYSSFGLSRIKYSVDKVLNLITTLGKSLLMNQFISLLSKTETIRRNSLYAELRQIFSEVDIENIDNHLATIDDGNSIYRDFKYSGSFNEDTNLETLFPNIQRQISNFEINSYNSYIIRLEDNKEVIFKKYVNNLSEIIEKYIQKNNINHASSVIYSILPKDDCPYIKGDLIERVKTLTDISNKLLDKFSKLCGLGALKKDLENLYKNLEIEEKSLEYIVNNIEIIKNQSPNKDKMEASGIQIRSLEERKRKIENTIKEIETSIETFEKNLTEIGELLTDPSRKSELVQKVEENSNYEIEKTKNDINKTDKQLRTAKLDFYGLLNNKQRFLKRYLVYYPIALIFSYTLLGSFLYALSYDSFIFLGLIHSLKYLYVDLFPFNLFIPFIYILISVIRYLKKIRNEVISKERLIQKLKDSKVSLIDKYITLLNKKLKLKWQFHLIDAAKTVIDKIAKWCEEYLNDLEEFRKNFFSYKETLDHAWENGSLPDSLFDVNIVKKEDCEYLLLHNIKELSLDIFLMRKGMTYYFRDFRKTKNLKKFDIEYSNYLRREFNYFKEYSVSDFIFTDTKIKRSIKDKNRLVPENRIKALYDSCLPLLSLTFQYTENYKPTAQSVLFTEEHTSDIKKICEDNYTENIQFAQRNDKYSIQMFKFMIGFPAYMIGQLIHFRDKYNSMKQKESYFSDERYLSYDLFGDDIVYIENNKEKNEYIDYVIANMLNIISINDENGKLKYSYKDKVIGYSIQEVINNIEKRRNLYKQIQKDIEKSKNDAKFCIAKADKELENLLKDENTNKVNINIIEEFLYEINPVD